MPGEDEPGEYTYYSLSFDDGESVYPLVRADEGVVEMWRRTAKEWVDAPWHWDAVYGREWRERTEIDEDAVNKLMNSADLADPTDEDLPQFD